MCGRYFIDEANLTQEFSHILDVLKRKNNPNGLKTAGEIFPTDIVPVLANSRRQKVEPFAMRWGFSTANGRLIINARSETAAEKPMFRDGMKQRRCLIPASCYFEWEHKKKSAVKFALRPPESKMIYLAGLYRLEPCGSGLRPEFVILTRQAAPKIAFLHDRMPVVLSAGQAAAWLDLENPAEEVLKSAVLEMEYCPAQA